MLAVELTPGSTVKAKLKARRKSDKESIELKLSWRVAQPDEPERELIISKSGE